MPMAGEHKSAAVQDELRHTSKKRRGLFTLFRIQPRG